MYEDYTSPRMCGDCTDMMMRSPVCAQRISGSTRVSEDACDASCNNCAEDGCGIADAWSDAPLAIVSSPYQGFGDVFDCPCEALKHGTLFRLLDLPILDAPGPRCRGGYNA